MFVLRGYTRSGTEMLRSALDQHPDIICHGPIFTDKNKDELAKGDPQRLLLAKNLRPTDGFVMGAGPPRGDDVVRLAVSEMWGYVASQSMAVVAIQRRDILRMVVSDAIQRTGRPRTVKLSDKPNKTKQTLLIRPEQLLRAAAAAQQVADITASQFPWAKVVYYEDMLANWNTKIDEILSYIGATRMYLGAMTRRQEVRKIRKIVQNYEELKTELYGSRPELFDIAEHTDGIFSY